MSIAAQVRLRYRDEGHLRFDLPAALSQPDQAAALLQALRARDGIYRADLSARGRKLSIRYLPTVCDFRAVVTHLHAVLSDLPEPPPPATQALVTTAAQQPVAACPACNRSALSRWLEAKWLEILETLTAMKLLIGRFTGLGANGQPQRPRWIKEFLNDLVMLYLIKYHWHHIVTEWIPRPWTHRYEWAATVYLIYLSLQARLPQNA